MIVTVDPKVRPAIRKRLEGWLASWLRPPKSGIVLTGEQCVFGDIRVPDGARVCFLVVRSGAKGNERYAWNGALIQWGTSGSSLRFVPSGTDDFVVHIKNYDDVNGVGLVGCPKSHRPQLRIRVGSRVA